MLANSDIIIYTINILKLYTYPIVDTAIIGYSISITENRWKFLDSDIIINRIAAVLDKPCKTL